MSNTVITVNFTTTDIAAAAAAIAALQGAGAQVSSVSHETSFDTAVSPDVAAQAPAGNGQTPRGSREINDVLAVTTDAYADKTRYFNVYKNKPSESEYRDETHAASYASDTRQALLSITQYEDGQVSMVLKDVRHDLGAAADTEAAVKSVRFFNVYGNRPSSKAWESRAQADEKASDTRKAVLVITRYEDDTVGMQLVDTRS